MVISKGKKKNCFLPEIKPVVVEPLITDFTQPTGTVRVN